MSNLVLSPQYNEIVQANTYLKAIYNGRVLRSMTNDEKGFLLVDAIGRATFIGGWKINDNEDQADKDMIATASILLQDLNGKFAGMTDLEVLEAFQKGSKGEYGENFGISPAGCLRWLNAYFADTSRNEAKKWIAAIENYTPSKEPTQQEKRNKINEAYEKYCLEGEYNDYGNPIYSWLDAEGLITYTIDQKNEFVMQAERLTLERLNNWKSAKEKRENDRKLSDIIEGTENSKSAIKAFAKRLALCDYFRFLKMAGVTSIKFND